MDLPVVPQELIDKAVRRFEMEAHRRTKEATPSPPRVITISRQLGSGGKRVAQFLSERLGWPVWDRQILEVIASQSNLHYQARMFEALDESTRGAIEDAMYALLGGVSKDVYLHLLPRAILIAAQNDAIILGRGAHLVLPDALKVRIEASRDTRVRNLMRFEGVSEREARDRIAVSDREREGFVRELQGRLRPGARRVRGDPEYDITLNTDRFTPEEAADIIYQAAVIRFDMWPPQTRTVASA